MKYNCPNCGAPVYPDRRSCPYCGTTYGYRDDEVTLYADNRPIISVSSAEIQDDEIKLRQAIERLEDEREALEYMQRLTANSILTMNEIRRMVLNGPQ